MIRPQKACRRAQLITSILWSALPALAEVKQVILKNLTRTACQENPLRSPPTS
jgi:hypothetical protein